MDSWTVMAPHARMSFRAKDTRKLADFEDTLDLVSGCKKKSGLWTIPYNVMPALAAMLQLERYAGVEVGAAAWGVAPGSPPEWEAVKAHLLEQGEVRPWVLDGFLMAYQMDALAFGWDASGVAYWHPTGSGKTLTGLLCSLSVPGAVLVVTRAASRLQYAREIERFLNVRAFVVRPSSDTGPVTVKGEGRIEWMARNRRLGEDTYTGMDKAEFSDRYKQVVNYSGLSYKEWSAENAGAYSREEKKAAWAAYKEAHTTVTGLAPDAFRAAWAAYKDEHTTKGINLVEAWGAYKEEHGVDPPRSLSTYLAECEAAGRRPFVVVGWESLVDNLNDVLNVLRPASVIYDESHRGKNSKRWDVVHLPEESDDTTPAEVAKIHREQAREAKSRGGFIKETEDGRKMFLPTMNQAAAAARVSRAVRKRIGTTATPIKDRVRDLWAQLDLLEPNAWGNKTRWMERYADMKPGVYGGMDTSGSSNLDELKLRIDTVAHILAYEETHRHLPPKRRQSVYLAPEDQCKPTGGFAREIREARARGPGAMLEVKLAMAASRKRQAVLGMIEDHVSSGHKIVVFTGRKRDCDALGEAVRKLKLVKSKEATVWSAHGGQTTEVRQGIIDEYMAHPGPCVLVGTGHAFGESLNIHDTDAAFFVMLPYTPGQLRQWEGRFTRLGQERPVIIYYVIAEGTVDEHIASILIDKLPAVQDIAEDNELAAAHGVLAGTDTDPDDDTWIDSILDDLDLD
jgi:superfamily II DNA or RNA helicase